MLRSRESSPMPANIDRIYNDLPPNTIYNLPLGARLPFPVHYWMHRFGKKILYGTGALAGLYGAYKLGQHIKPVQSIHSSRKGTNRTRSGR